MKIQLRAIAWPIERGARCQARLEFWAGSRYLGGDTLARVYATESEALSAAQRRVDRFADGLTETLSARYD